MNPQPGLRECSAHGGVLGAGGVHGVPARSGAHTGLSGFFVPRLHLQLETESWDTPRVLGTRSLPGTVSPAAFTQWLGACSGLGREALRPPPLPSGFRLLTRRDKVLLPSRQPWSTLHGVLRPLGSAPLINSGLWGPGPGPAAQGEAADMAGHGGCDTQPQELACWPRASTPRRPAPGCHKATSVYASCVQKGP